MVPSGQECLFVPYQRGKFWGSLGRFNMFQPRIRWWDILQDIPILGVNAFRFNFSLKPFK